MTLDQLAADPALAADLAPQDVSRLILQATACIASLAAVQRAPEPPAGLDRLLSVDEAATLLGCSRSRLYKRARAGRYPFIVRDGSRVRFSAAGLQRWIAKRRG